MNVFVIVTDSLRADHCGCYPFCKSYNGRKVATPSLDRLAGDGTVFEHTYSESLPTIPTRTTWWTGRTGFPVRGWQAFDPGDYLLAEVLWDKGFTSALVTDTYHMHKPVYNCGRGFDTVTWVRGQEYDPWIVDDVPVDVTRNHRLKGDASDELWRPRFEQYLRNRSAFKTEGDYPTARVSAEATRWLEDTVKRKGIKDRLFLWVDFFDPHEPWDPPEAYWNLYKDPAYRGPDIIDPVAGPTKDYLKPDEVQRIASLYAGEVTFVDKWAGMLLDRIRDLGLYEDSLILWLSDHGEPFGEHGIIRKAQPWNYEELVRIPMVLKPPASLKAKARAPARVRALAQTTDVMPTILETLGISTPLPLVYRAPSNTGTFPQDMSVSRKEVHLHGHSLLPLLRGETDRIRRYACSGHFKQSWSIQDEEWRYQVFLNNERPPELFHRPDDPYDQRNVLAQHREVGDALELELRRWAAQRAS